MAWQGQLVPAEPFFELAKIAREDNNPAIQKWILGACLSGNGGSVNSLARYLNIKAAQQLARQKPFYIPQAEQVYANENTNRLVGFGYLQDAEVPFAQSADRLTEHLGVWGATGTGKTTLLTLLILQAVQHCKVWIWDRQKLEFRQLARVIPDLVVLDAQDDIDNPLEVHPDVTPQQTIANFVSVFSKSFGLLIGSQSLLIEAVYELFEEHGIFAGNSSFPIVRDLRDKLSAKKLTGRFRSAQARDSLLNRIDAMLLETPKAYAYSRGFPISELGKRNLVIEVKNLSEHHARFRAMSRLYALFQHRIRTGQRRNYLMNLAVFDEAAWVAPCNTNVGNIGWAPLAEILRMSRSAGLGLCFASQTADLEDALLENTRTRFVFRLGHGKHIERIAKGLALTKEQADYIPKLGTAECIAQIPQVEPFLLRIPELGL